MGQVLARLQTYISPLIYTASWLCGNKFSAKWVV